MTIDTIFTRYEVPTDVQERALRRGAYVLALQKAWVGPSVTWPLLVKVLMFADLGETSALIRKKTGLDKYAVTLIARGVPKYAETIAQSHDWHQKIYLYCAHMTGIVTDDGTKGGAFGSIVRDVLHNLLHDVPVPEAVSVEDERLLRAINILHYKNPSV